MPRNAAMAGLSREPAKAPSSIACLAFVAVLATALWAGAVWIGHILLQVLAGG
jgi:hypothetical protein